MTTEFQLIIISAEKEIFSGKVISFTAPGVGGRFGVFADHAPMITALKKGTINYAASSGEQSLDVNGGIVEVDKNVATICIE